MTTLTESLFIEVTASILPLGTILRLDSRTALTVTCYFSFFILLQTSNDLPDCQELFFQPTNQQQAFVSWSIKIKSRISTPKYKM